MDTDTQFSEYLQQEIESVFEGYIKEGRLFKVRGKTLTAPDFRAQLAAWKDDAVEWDNICSSIIEDVVNCILAGRDKKPDKAEVQEIIQTSKTKALDPIACAYEHYLTYCQQTGTPMLDMALGDHIFSLSEIVEAVKLRNREIGRVVRKSLIYAALVGIFPEVFPDLES